MRISPALLSVFLPSLVLAQATAGPFPPAAGTEGSLAVPMDSEALIAWAETVAHYAPGTHLDLLWTDETKA